MENDELKEAHWFSEEEGHNYVFQFSGKMSETSSYRKVIEEFESFVKKIGALTINYKFLEKRRAQGLKISFGNLENTLIKIHPPEGGHISSVTTNSAYWEDNPDAYRFTLSTYNSEKNILELVVENSENGGRPEFPAIVIYCQKPVQE